MDICGYIIVLDRQMEDVMRARKQPRHPRLAEAVYALGRTRQERADKLGSSAKTLDRIIDDLPIQFRLFEKAPHLLRALAEDLEALSTN